MKYRLTIKQDMDPESPREWGNLGTFAGWHSRYQIGDIQPSEDPEEYRKGLADDEVVLPVYMYDHGGVTYSTGAFGCPWDSGQVGIIHAPKDEAIACGIDPEKIKEILRGEVETYSQWAGGDVWGFELEKWEPSECGDGTHGEWEYEDSCWGFYGSDYRENGMIEHFPDELVAHLDNLTFPFNAPCEIDIPEEVDPVAEAQARYDRACAERASAAAALIKVQAANPTRYPGLYAPGGGNAGCDRCGVNDREEDSKSCGHCAESA